MTRAHCDEPSHDRDGSDNVKSAYFAGYCAALSISSLIVHTRIVPADGPSIEQLPQPNDQPQPNGNERRGD
jgi:hypothetical protein